MIVNRVLMRERLRTSPDGKVSLCNNEFVEVELRCPGGDLREGDYVDHDGWRVKVSDWQLMPQSVQDYRSYERTPKP
jgi:hypothetical protein